jgi:hypothetical protein
MPESLIGAGNREARMNAADKRSRAPFMCLRDS